jgi:hypothetical protein
MIPFKLVSITCQSGSCNSPFVSRRSSQNDVVCNPAFATTISICRHAFRVVRNRVDNEDQDWTSVRIYAQRLNVISVVGLKRLTFLESFQIECLLHRRRPRKRRMRRVGEGVRRLRGQYRLRRLDVRSTVWKGSTSDDGDFVSEGC